MLGINRGKLEVEQSFGVRYMEKCDSNQRLANNMANLQKV